MPTRLEILTKEVNQTTSSVSKLEGVITSAVNRIEQMFISNASMQIAQSAGVQPQVQNFGQFQRGGQTNRFPRGAARGMQAVRPSLTGGVGYVNNIVQPSQLRLPASNFSSNTNAQSISNINAQ